MKFKSFTFLAILLMLIPFYGNSAKIYSQNLSDFEINSNHSVFTFSFDNDVLLKTDRYYTNGFIFSLLKNFSHSSLINSRILSANDLRNYYQISLKQKIYTPKNFSLDEISVGDRPFSANLILSYNELSFSKSQNFIVKSFFSIGVIGQIAFGKEVQNGIHSLLPHSSDVPGWEYQIPNGLLAEAGMLLEKQILSWKSILINGETDFSLGLPQTMCGMGIHLVVSSSGDYFNFPFRLNNDKKSVLFDVRVKVISKFYDANLQGMPWGKTAPYIISRPKFVLLNLSSGIKYRIDNWSFAINLYYLSPEFQSGESHLWNRFSISRIF